MGFLRTLICAPRSGRPRVTPNHPARIPTRAPIGLWSHGISPAAKFAKRLEPEAALAASGSDIDFGSVR